MADETGISWTDATWNPWLGCTKVSRGCDYCYMFREQRQYGGDPEDVRRSKTKFDAPLKMKEPRLIFTCSWSDWFHVDADPWRDEAWDIIRRCPQHVFQILTKRPGRIHRHLPSNWGDGWPNVWLGVSVEDAAVLHRVDQLRAIPAAMRFISAEPLLGSLYAGSSAEASAQDRVPSLTGGVAPSVRGTDRTRREGGTDGVGARVIRPSLDLSGFDWVIVGGESGPRAQARPMHPQWAREIRDACLAGDHPFLAGAPMPHRPAFHFKQWGAWTTDPNGNDPNGLWVMRDGVAATAMQIDMYDGLDISGAVRMGYAGPTPKAGGKMLDGIEWCEIPERPELGQLTLA